MEQLINENNINIPMDSIRTEEKTLHISKASSNGQQEINSNSKKVLDEELNEIVESSDISTVNNPFFALTSDTKKGKRESLRIKENLAKSTKNAN